MTRHFNEDANAIVVQAYEHAVRLGHPYLGGEHLLLALATLGQPTLAGTVLREHGVTRGRVEAEIVRLVGGGLFGDLDRGALAARTAHRQPSWFDPRPRSVAGRPGTFLPHGPGAEHRDHGPLSPSPLTHQPSPTLIPPSRAALTRRPSSRADSPSITAR